MIDRFNFYDVYAYAIPGLVLMALLWLPYGLAVGELPDVNLLSALVLVVLAYVAGHMLQLLGRTAFSSKFRMPGGDQLRYPSDMVLDHDDPTLSREVRQQIITRIRERFQLDVADEAFADEAKRTDETNGLTEASSKTPEGEGGNSRERVRNDAFMLCRAALVTGETASYAEQFQGMYALMRGLLAAFVFAAAFQVGWALKSSAFQLHFYLGVVVQLLVVLALAAVAIVVVSTRWKAADWDQYGKSHWWRELLSLSAQGRLPDPDVQVGSPWWFYGTTGLFLVVGSLALFGVADQGGLKTTIFLPIVAVALLCLAYLCKRCCESFGYHFASSVYRHLLLNRGDTNRDR